MVVLRQGHVSATGGVGGYSCITGWIEISFGLVRSCQRPDTLHLVAESRRRDIFLIVVLGSAYMLLTCESISTTQQYGRKPW